jgi:uncharacterized repeat protein (TIGR02543 family)
MKRNVNHDRKHLVLVIVLLFINSAFLPALMSQMNTPVISYGAGELYTKTLIPAIDPTTGGSIDARSSSPIPLDDPWVDSSCYYRKKITFDNHLSSTALVDFPVLINISIDSSKAPSSNYIRFYDGSTLLPKETEQWNPLSTSLFWVKVPQIDATASDYIYMYYGPVAISNPDTPSTVWNSGFVMVQHLEEITGTSTDSTSYHNDGTPTGVNQNVGGKIDGADYFNKTHQHNPNSYTAIPTSVSLNLTSAISVEVWAKNDRYNVFQTIASKDSVTNQEWWFGYGQNNRLDFKFNNGGDRYGNTVITNTNWHYLAGTYDGSNIWLYMDGSSDNTPASNAPITLYNTPVNLARTQYSAADVNYNGTLDEVRISNVARSPDWIKASYLNMNSATGFITFGAEERISYTLTINIDPVVGGSVDAVPSPPYYYGDVVTLTASANPGYTFDHWSGDASGTSLTTTVTMDSDKTVTAHFTQNVYTLMINVDPVLGGSVDAVPSPPYHYGDSVTLTASANPYYTFDCWTGDASGTSPSITVTMDTDKSITANFGWSVLLTFTNQTSPTPKDTATFGEKADASDGQDVYDVPKPGIPPNPYIFVWFKTALPSPYNRLWRDFRYYPHTDQTWDLWVQAKTTQSEEGINNITIAWVIANVTASEYNYIDLFNASDIHLANMIAENTYTLLNVPNDTPVHLKIKCRTNQAPTAAFSYTPLYPAVDETVTFTDASFDLDGSIVEWAWLFGDSGTSDEQNPTHQYTENGTYTVRLTVTDDDGETSYIEHDVTVGEVPPIAAFSYSPESPTTEDTVQFTDASSDSDGTIVSWMWDFGDTGSSTLQNPTHQYANNGVYTVRLTVTDDDGSTGFVEHDVTVGGLYHISLKSRWNLISIPCYESVVKTDIIVWYDDASHTWAQAVADSIIMDAIYYWQRTTQAYTTTEILQPGEGFWVWAYEDCELQIYSYSAGTGQITDLKFRWNMMGLPYGVSVDKTNVIINYDGTNYTWGEAVANYIILEAVYGWNRLTQAYTEESMFNPGYGYWMYAYDDCRLYIGV